MNVTLWDTSSDVRKELSIQDDRTESDNRIEVTLLIGIAENNLPHIARWESTKPPYAEPHVRWCGRSVNVKIGGRCLCMISIYLLPDFCFKLAYHRLSIEKSPADQRFPLPVQSVFNENIFFYFVTLTPSQSAWNALFIGVSVVRVSVRVNRMKNEEWRMKNWQ